MRSLYGVPFLALICSLGLFTQIATSTSFPRETVVIPQLVVRQTTSSGGSQPTSFPSGLPNTTISLTSTPTASSVNVSVATAIVNQPLGTISVSDTKSSGGNSNAASGSIGLACANCSTFGTLSFSEQKFSFENGTITGGIFEMGANGFGGIFELNLTAAQLKYEFTHNILNIPIPGLAIGASGENAGIILEIGADFSIELDDSIEFTLGGTFNVPDGSIISFDVTDLGNSTQHGFTTGTGLKLAPIPFQANISSPALTASIAIQPKLVLGIHALDNAFYAEAGIDFNLPKISVQVERLTNVDANCNTVNETGNPNAIPGNVTNVIPSAEIDIGLLADAGLIAVKDSGSTQLASESLPLPTACLMFDAAAKTFGQAAPPATSSAPGSSPSGSSNGSGIIGKTPGSAAAGSPEFRVWSMTWGLGVILLSAMILL